VRLPTPAQLSALPTTVATDQVRLVTKANASACQNGCTLERAAENSYIFGGLLHWNADSGSYLDLNTTGRIEPWQGFWLLVNSKAVNDDASLLFAGQLSTPGASVGIAAGEAKFLGNVIGNYIPGDFATYWNQVTLENAGKWGSLEQTRDNMNWAPIDAAVEFANLGE